MEGWEAFGVDTTLGGLWWLWLPMEHVAVRVCRAPLGWGKPMQAAGRPLGVQGWARTPCQGCGVRWPRQMEAETPRGKLR